MKRTIALIIAATVLCFTLVGCGGGKPNDVSQEMYDVGIAALQVADDYMAYKISGEEAKSKIEAISDDADTIYDRNKETKYETDYVLAASINALSAAISLANWNGVPSDVKEQRDRVAKYLGK